MVSLPHPKGGHKPNKMIKLVANEPRDSPNCNIFYTRVVELEGARPPETNVPKTPQSSRPSTRRLPQNRKRSLEEASERPKRGTPRATDDCDGDEDESDNEDVSGLVRVTVVSKKRRIVPLSGPWTYPIAIRLDIRELVDDDFENSWDYCPFFLHHPLQYSHKPWSSCSKQRAEISHMVVHIISDHGVIRGSHRHRPNQRYITRCGSRIAESKGRSNCVTCSQVEEWTEQELGDLKHDGPSVCLRCFAELPTKADLHEHLHTPSICLYREDNPMRAKARTLYQAFCSADEVPRFRPPPESAAPREGARKRNLKSPRRRFANVSVSYVNSLSDGIT